MKSKVQNHKTYLDGVKMKGKEVPNLGPMIKDIKISNSLTFTSPSGTNSRIDGSSQKLFKSSFKPGDKLSSSILKQSITTPQGMTPKRIQISAVEEFK